MKKKQICYRVNIFLFKKRKFDFRQSFSVVFTKKNEYNQSHNLF